jgi:aspartate ammonia-lyase
VNAYTPIREICTYIISLAAPLSAQPTRFFNEAIVNDNGFRVERDSLGSVNVPDSALYGAQTQRAVLNFPVSGLRPWRAFIWSMAAIKRAAAEVNRDLGLLDPQIAEAVLQAAGEVMEGRWDAQFVVDPFQAGAGTSHNMNTNEVIANRATQILGGQVGEYRSTPTTMSICRSRPTTPFRPPSAWAACGGWTSCWTPCKAGSGLECESLEFDDIVKSGRTHLQDAVPVRLGQEFGAYARAVERDAERIERAAEGCAGWALAARRPGRAQRPPRISRPHGTKPAAPDRAESWSNPITCLKACSRWPIWPIFLRSSAPWRSP